jgi:hypothetical protein
MPAGLNGSDHAGVSLYWNPQSKSFDDWKAK